MLFTVAITVWRREDLLPRAIESVLCQTHTSWELLVLSDGFSRTTRRIVDGLRPSVAIRYEPMERRRKLWGNHLRRAALERGSGSHVCYLGHDCYLFPTYLETHARLLANDERAMSVVPVDYWREAVRDGVRPTKADLMALTDGEIDLLCIAYPRLLALQTDCFGEDMLRRRPADYLSYDRLRRIATLRFSGGPSQAAHF